MLLTNVNIATLAGSVPYGLIEDGALAVEEGKVLWAGSKRDLPSQFGSQTSIDFGGRLLTPAFVDCHTHIVAGGNRAREFEMRLEGATYEQIALAGGGIVSTVQATREASEEALLEDALVRVDTLISEGACLIEIKSGYGLDLDTELKMLRVARRVEKERPIRVQTSFLGAHATPSEYSGRSDAYIDEVCIPALRVAATEHLVDAVDGFCEGIAFQPEQIARVFDVARELGLPVKLHAEQLSNIGGAKLAASYGALSADHIEYLDTEGVSAMAQAGTTAVVLPGAFYTLRESQLPPIAALRSYGVPIALATDSNPGSSPLTSLLLTMNMACTLFRMTPEEALAGATKNAARALGISDCGTIEVGKRADLAVWDVEHPSELSYRIGFNPLHKRIFEGVL